MRVAISDTGIAMVGMIEVRQFWRKTKTTATTRIRACAKVMTSYSASCKTKAGRSASP